MTNQRQEQRIEHPTQWARTEGGAAVAGPLPFAAPRVGDPPPSLSRTLAGGGDINFQPKKNPAPCDCAENSDAITGRGVPGSGRVGA